MSPELKLVETHDKRLVLVVIIDLVSLDRLPKLFHRFERGCRANHFRIALVVADLLDRSRDGLETRHDFPNVLLKSAAAKFGVFILRHLGLRIPDRAKALVLACPDSRHALVIAIEFRDLRLEFPKLRLVLLQLWGELRHVHS